MSSGRWAASWAASSATRAPWRCAMRDDLPRSATPRPSRSRRPSPRRARAAAERASAASSAASASAGLAGIGRWRTSPRRHGSRFAWCSPAKVSTVVPPGSAPASRLNASVVLRVNRTRSSSRAPTNAAHDLPRAGVRLGAHQRGEARAAVHAAVVRQQLRDGVGDRPAAPERSPRCRGSRSGPTRRPRAGRRGRDRRAPAGARRRCDVSVGACRHVACLLLDLDRGRSPRPAR